MTFYHPIWLLLALPLSIPLLLWRPSSKSVLALRIAVLLLIVLAMAGLAIKLPSYEGTVVAVVDRSRSMPQDAERRVEEALRVLDKNCHGGNRFGIVSFSESAGIEKMPGNRIFDGLKINYQGDQSDLSVAMENALSLIPDNSPGRIIILSDGVWTGREPTAAFAESASRGIPVDFRLFGQKRVNDLAIKDIHAPYIAPTGEFYTIQVGLKSPSAKEVAYAIQRNGHDWMKGKLKLRAGNNRFLFRDRAMTPQTVRYRLKLLNVEDDPCPGNNLAGFMVKIQGKRPVLLVTMSRVSGLGKTLKKAGVNVEVRTPQETDFSLAGLSGYCGIVLENVPASLIGVVGMDTIAQLVRKSGAGLLLTGGKNSYGPGGYYKSPLEDIIPVSMELRREHRKLSMAIVLVLDRSGSMAAWAASGGRTKMDLANIASAEVLDMLTAMDNIGVIAVDSQPHTIVPLMSAEQAAARKGDILHIQSTGGGIFVYNGLAAAGKMLAESKSGTRHVILFADAADAEQPGSYKELLEKFRQAGITVSVIGLGTEGDCDAEFLKDVARRGGGRCFFTSNAGELPRLFTQDTFVVARNTFIDERTTVKLTGAFRALGAGRFGSSFALGGYNLCYARPEARVGAVSEDEYKAPIIAFWQAELGRAACFTGDVDGKYSGPFGKWKYAGKMLTDMVTWCSGDKQALPGGMMITQNIVDGIHQIRLHLNPERVGDPFKGRPEVVTLAGVPGRKPQSTVSHMHWESPDTLLAEIPLKSAETSLSTVKIAHLAPQVLAPVMLPYSPEYKPADDDSDRSSLKSLSGLTGGKERIDIAGIWDELPVIPRIRSVASWLLIIAVLLLLLEVLQRRTGLLLKWRRAISLKKTAPVETAETSVEVPAAGKQGRKRVKRSRGKTATTTEKVSSEPKAEKPSAKKTEEPEEHQVLSAFGKAKKSGRK